MKGKLTGISISGQLVFGECLSDTPEKILLKNPRVFQQVPAPNGKGVMNSLVPYIGGPEQVTFYKRQIAFSYHPIEKDLKNAYIEVTTGIQIATIIPLREGKVQ